MTDFVLPDAPARNPGWPKELPPTLSPTSITNFLECPERFRRAYLQGETQKVSGALLIGSADSDTAEANFAQKCDTREDLPLADVEFIAAESFDQRVQDEDVSWEDKDGEKTPGQARDTLIRVIRANHATEYPLIPQPVLVEHTVELQVEGVPTVARARLDVADATRVVSRKTAARTPAGPSRAWLTQSAIESAALGLPTVFHITTKAKQPKVVAPEVGDTGFAVFPDVAQAERLAANMIRAAAGGMVALLNEFGPDEHWPQSAAMHYGARGDGGQSACSYCAFRLNGCPAWASS